MINKKKKQLVERKFIAIDDIPAFARMLNLSRFVNPCKFKLIMDESLHTAYCC